MRLYTVHLRLHGPGRDLVLVKEGFCWPAFFFSVLWALWHRLWLAAALIFAVQVVLSAGLALLGPDPVSQSAVSIGVAVIVGFLANDLRRWALGRRGYMEHGVVLGADVAAAERTFLESEPAWRRNLWRWAA